MLDADAVGVLDCDTDDVDVVVARSEGEFVGVRDSVGVVETVSVADWVLLLLVETETDAERDGEEEIDAVRRGECDADAVVEVERDGVSEPDPVMHTLAESDTDVVAEGDTVREWVREVVPLLLAESVAHDEADADGQ